MIKPIWAPPGSAKPMMKKQKGKFSSHGSDEPAVSANTELQISVGSEIPGKVILLNTRQETNHSTIYPNYLQVII